MKASALVVVYGAMHLALSLLRALRAFTSGRRQVEDPRSHRQVERGDRLVAHDEARLDRERAGGDASMTLVRSEMIIDPSGDADAFIDGKHALVLAKQ
ncbi:MAG: hypothetical protein JOY67_14350 [Hyphomicrobiales bacterium]|nr:hypothetical protein [Hyphomicrobiales bacterium]